MNFMRLALALVLSSSLLSCVLKSKYEERDLDARELSKKAEELKAENGALRKDIDDKAQTMEKLELRNQELSSVNQKLVDKNRELSTDNTEFIKKSIMLEQDLAKKDARLSEMQKTHESLSKDLEKEISAGNVKIDELKGMLRVNVVGEVLFRSGSDEIIDSGKEILDKVAHSLSTIKDKRIEIQGHTDDQKIYGKLKERFPTNWELSTARATSVVRYLESQGLEPGLLSASGMSMYHPVDTNKTEAGRQKNRRIEIMLLPMLEGTSKDR